MKTELLTQLDGVRGVSAAFTVLAATNRPWDLDDALLRRLERRVHVPPPNPQHRRRLIETAVRGTSHLLEDADVDALVVKSEMYSGADVVLACREASMAPLRRAIDGVDPAKLADVASDLGGAPVEVGDFENAFAATAPSISPEDAKRHAAWAARFGAG